MTKKEGKEYIQNHNLFYKMDNSTHIVWGTGGNLVPKDVMKKYYNKGIEIISNK